MSGSWKILVLGVFAVFVAGNAIAANCKPVTGRISSLDSVDPAQCPSVLGCFQGTSTGNFNGSFQSMLTLPFTPVDAEFTRFVFTATTILTTGKGSITFADAGVSTFVFGVPQTAEVLRIVSGTGDYSQATGEVFITGDYVPPGEGFGELGGQICY